MFEATCESPVNRVVVSDAAVPFIARGGRLFGGQVVLSDPGIEDGEEVLVMDQKSRPIRIMKIKFNRS